MKEKSKVFYIICFILIIACSSILGYYYTNSLVQKNHIAKFKSIAADQTDTIQEKLEIALQTSLTVRAFFLSSLHVSLKGFKIFTNPILKQNKMIQSIGWAPKVFPHTVKQFMARAKSFHPIYKIHEKRKNGDIVAAKKRSVYYPILYLNPMQGNENRLGYDVACEHNQLTALEKARDLGKPVMSSFLKLTQMKKAEYGNTVDGFIIFVPVYQKDAMVQTLHERRENIIGYILTVFKLNEILKTPYNDKRPLLNISISDLNSKYHAYKPSNELSDYIFQKEANIATGRLVISIRPTKLYIAGYKSYLSLIVAGGLFILTTLLLLYIYVILAQSRKINKLVSIRTDELAFQNKQISLIESVQKKFILGEDPYKYFDNLLNNLLDLTNSQYGFIGEIKEKEGKKYLKTFAMTNIAWDYETRYFHKENASNGLEFHNLDTLFGEVIKTKNIVISDDPACDKRSGGLPKGHPPLKNFLGIPIFTNSNFVGMAGVANAPENYTEKKVQQIEPFITTIGLMIMAHNIEKDRKNEEELNQHLASMDKLTEIPNRHSFDLKFDTYVALTKREAFQSALLLVDLDGFKLINDEYGHLVGDKVLQYVANTMKRRVRHSDFVARVGGDEFAVILYNIHDRENLVNIVETLIGEVNKPLTIDNATLKIGISIGISIFSAEKKSLKAIYKHADDAMYSAKNKGKNTYVIY